MDNGVFVLENNQLLPFERNRYYIGKLLTSADFQAEQTYMNQKRHFLNKMMFGDGIVCGLGVYNLDDMSVMVESGVGVDGLGREIVVPSSVMKKLSAVEGFETLESDHAVLCLRYQEEPVHPVYAVRSQELGEGYECNRIREGYQLFLQDAHAMPDLPAPESEFLTSALLYIDSDFSVELSLPTVVSCSRPVRLQIKVTRRSDVQALFSMETVLQTPSLLSADGEHELPVKLTDLYIPDDTPVIEEFWLTAQAQPATDSVIIAGAESTRIRVGESDRAMSDNFMMKVSVEDTAPSALVARAIGAVSLETRELAGAWDFIPLADVYLQQAKNSYLIDHISQADIRRYLHLPASATLRETYDAWFIRPAGIAGPAAGTVTVSGEEETTGRTPEPVYATGVCEIPLGSGARRGQIFRSDEILHGLGTGNVFVQVGFEFLSEDPKLGATARSTIYGDPQFFAEEEPPISYADTAIKVNNDRGSFVVAAQLTRDTPQTLLTLRWVAIRLPVGDEPSKLQRLSGKSIAAVQPTVVLATRESHFFNVKFKNMEPCTLTYELTERDSGEITSDGIYTAPAKEGVYEIRISCADMPLVSTYAYAVVKKRDTEEETSG